MANPWRCPHSIRWGQCLESTCRTRSRGSALPLSSLKPSTSLAGDLAASGSTAGGTLALSSARTYADSQTRAECMLVMNQHREPRFTSRVERIVGTRLKHLLFPALLCQTLPPCICSPAHGCDSCSRRIGGRIMCQRRRCRRENIRAWKIHAGANVKARPCSLPCCDARGQCARVASTRWGEFNDQHSIIYAPNVDVWINSLLRAAPDDPSEKGHSSILPRTRPETPLTLTLILSETRNAPAPACRCRTATALDAHGSTTRHDGGKIEGLRTE